MPRRSSKMIYVKALDEEEPLETSPSKASFSKKEAFEEKKEPDKERIVLRKLSSSKQAGIKVDEVDNAATPKRKSSFSFRLGKNRNKPVAAAETDDEKAMAETEDDPVMALFAARTKQRVRFSLEGSEPKEERAARKSSEKASSSFNIKKFMTGSLFGGRGLKGEVSHGSDNFDEEVAKEMETAEMVWESTESPTGPEVVRTGRSLEGRSGLTVSFTEDVATRKEVIKLLNKARRAQFVHYRYEYAVKCYVKALDKLSAANYPEDHPTTVKTLESLNNAHHALSSYKNSANIVKMGIKYEDNGELIRALKMYTIAYRIRRDNLSKTHPSLPVLLNMLGSIQVKRGELEEAMQIYELALKDVNVKSDGSAGDTSSTEDAADEPSPTGNLLAQSVTYREMGTVYEEWGEVEDALDMYRKSLECVAQFKALSTAGSKKTDRRKSANTEEQSQMSQDAILLDLEHVRLSKAFSNRSTTSSPLSGCLEDQAEDPDMEGENGEMELVIGSSGRGRKQKPSEVKITSTRYDVFFPPSLEEKPRKKNRGAKKTSTTSSSKRAVAKGSAKQEQTESSSSATSSKDHEGNYADIDLALTLHQIAQLHRSVGEYNLALEAFNVSLRGMKHALGKHHPNVAAVLGNLGNLQKEMGDMDGAFSTYQQVLGIESYRLGLSHPDVVVTLHNIATIDAARGNHDNALVLYQQVLSLQRKLFGDDHLSVAVTSACMGDVYERIGDLKTATESYEEALRIKTAALGRHSLEVARLLHKLGKLSKANDDYSLADSYIARAVLIYRLNKLSQEDEWVVDAHRDAADIDAAIAMGGGERFEC